MVVYNSYYFCDLIKISDVLKEYVQLLRLLNIFFRSGPDSEFVGRWVFWRMALEVVGCIFGEWQTGVFQKFTSGCFIHKATGRMCKLCSF